MNIKAQIAKLTLKRDKIEKDILALQEKCQHLDVIKTHRANTGNYDPSADSYWIDYDCKICGKHWIED